MDKFAQLDQAANAGATGHNIIAAPTPAQQDAGNYAKGRVVMHGLRIAIECPRGTRREWRAEDGTSGSNLLKFHYGYFMGTRGADGDELDCSIGPWPEAPRAFVVNQFMRGKFDEHKVMLGFPDRRTAEAGYLSNYDPGWQGMQSCIPCSIDQLKWWIKNGNLTRPLTYDQLPYEGTDDTMKKVIWDSVTNSPLRSTLDQVLYTLRAHDAADGLLFDAVCMDDILADSDGVLVLDALVVPLAHLQRRMSIMQKVMDRAADAVKIAAMQVSEPFTQRGSTNVAVIYELTDGQTVTVFFHNPDVTPKKIAPGDDVISWKWMLNKKDITVAVAPERGRDLDVRTVATRIMRLADKNSTRFVAANGKRAEKMETIAGLKTELETKQAVLADLEIQIETATQARQVAGLEELPDLPAADPTVPDVPEPVVAATLNVDSIKAVVTSADPMPGVAVGAGWPVMNAPRPLMGTETTSNGEFLTGRFYAAIDPSDYMAQAYVDSNVKLDASVVFVADPATLTAMTLQSMNAKYLPAYMAMDEDDRASSISGFMRKLNGRTFGELTSLAAMGMPMPTQRAAPEPVVAAPEPELIPEPAPLPDLTAQHKIEIIQGTMDEAGGYSVDGRMYVGDEHEALVDEAKEMAYSAGIQVEAALARIIPEGHLSAGVQAEPVIAPDMLPDPVLPVVEVVPQPEPVIEPAAAPADLTYRTGDMFTAFLANTPAGEEAWKKIAAETDGTGKVQNSHVESTIQQLRDAGYTVSEGDDPTAINADELMAALGADEPVDVPTLAAAEPVIDPVAVVPAAVVAEPDDGLSLLRAMIDGTRDLSDIGIPGDLKALHAERKDDAEFMVLFGQAVKAYSAFAIAKANAAMSK
jgi:hypothetical protein